MKKTLSVVLFVLFAIASFAVIAQAQDDQFVLDQQAKLQARLIKAVDFQNDPSARLFHNAAILGISDREFLYKVLGAPDSMRYEDSGCTLILAWKKLDNSQIYHKMSGISWTPYGIKFIKKGNGWEIADAQWLSSLWVKQIDSMYGATIAAKK